MPTNLDPVFCTVPNDGTPSNLSVIETNLAVPTQSKFIFTAGANGSLVFEIGATATFTTLAPVTLAGLVYLFLNDGTTFWLFDTITIAAVTGSATAAPWRATPKQYPDGIILKTGWKVAASISVAPTSGTIQVSASGLDAP